MFGQFDGLISRMFAIGPKTVLIRTISSIQFGADAAAGSQLLAI